MRDTSHLHHQIGQPRRQRLARAALVTGVALGLLAPLATTSAPAEATPLASAPLAAAEAETTFTLVQVPDTQNEVLSDGDPLLADRYQWLSDNKNALNIKFAVHTGDVVNWGVADPVQFTRADAATKVLDASGIPYAYAVGNHDGAAVTVGGSAAPGDVRTNLRNTTLFNKTFPLSRFKDVEGTFEPGKVDNMYQTFTAGGKDWMVLTLEIWPRQAAIDWAKQVVASHPNHNVVINTHVNVDSSGNRVTTGVYGDKNAQVLWDQLGSQYANIRMILSGHYEPKGGVGGYYYDEVAGVNGNKVLQVMTAYTSPYQNHVRLLKIDTAKMTVTSSVYVNRSTNKAHPTGTITDSASSFVATGMNWVGKKAAAPAAPTGVTATADDASATVKFTAPADGGSPITSYTVTSTPGNLTAKGSGSPITVKGLTNGTEYTFTVKATNAVGTGSASAASAAVTPTAARGPELLPDPGFEKGTGSWSPFQIGEITRVTSPVHSGTSALKVQSTSATVQLTGLTQNAAVANSTAGKAYTAQCYVRPSTADLEVRIRLVEYAQDYSSNTKLGTTVVSTLPANTWTLVEVTGVAAASGKRIIPQVYASFQTKSTGYLVYDDCSLS